MKRTENETEPKKMKRTEKREIMDQMIQANITPTQIGKALQMSREHISRERAKLLKNPLMQKKRIRKAIENIDYFSVENYHQDKRIKPSDVLHASEIVIDRAFPKVMRSESINVNIQSEIDMSRYINNNNPQLVNNVQPIDIIEDNGGS